eukprot:TRINITY_DN4664_c0_g1_i2.p1 TRINITY_DN4664_c0_g1~~TRINITY_DN4664_c0_g1_i2.p1  ORF type:complete len:247 (-),score=92.17 TRINITY_DN4664_c0_g1_i2:16-756(-)
MEETQRDIANEMQGVRELYQKWQSLLSSGQGGTDEYEYITEELGQLIEGLGHDLNELEDTISVVEKHKEKFQVAEDAIRSHKQFAKNTKQTLYEMTSTMNSRETKSHIENQTRNALGMNTNSSGRKTDLSSRVRDAGIQENQEYINNQLLEQKDIELQQDEDVQDIAAAIEILKEKGKVIGYEVDKGAQTISDLDNDVTRANSGLKQVINKVNTLIDQTSDTKQLLIIGGLIAILLTLLILIFFWK